MEVAQDHVERWALGISFVKLLDPASRELVSLHIFSQSDLNASQHKSKYLSLYSHRLQCPYLVIPVMHQLANGCYYETNNCEGQKATMLTSTWITLQFKIANIKLDFILFTYAATNDRAV